MAFDLDSRFARRIDAQLARAAVGHCARVDFLTRATARAVCEALHTLTSADTLQTYILGTALDAAREPTLYITADQAIELRNRKRARLCLFVPADVVDAAFSSLANSFELIDGRALEAAVLSDVIKALSPAAATLYARIGAQLRRPLLVSTTHKLDLAGQLGEYAATDSLQTVGRELWRVGLLPDAGVDFNTRLESNRRAVLKLVRPAKTHATLRERLQALGVDATTHSVLLRFFQNRTLHDSATWLQDLARTGPTFDQWIFPADEASDLRAVTIAPFIRPDGAVEKSSKLLQPDGPGGMLELRNDPKSVIGVRWKTDPLRPNNLHSWRLEVVPANRDFIEPNVELPAKEVAGGSRSTTLKLGLELDESVDYDLRVRIVALDSAGNEMVSDADGTVVEAFSDEFIIVADNLDVAEEPLREKRRTVPTIAFGRLEIALESKETTLDETQPQISPQGNYFSLRLNERRLLNVGLSPLLVALERAILAKPASGGAYQLVLDELRSATWDEVTLLPLTQEGDGWKPFLQAREAFFRRLAKARPRDLMATAEWSLEVADAALRYASAYRTLLRTLSASPAAEGVRQLLLVDTLSVRLETGSGVPEEAVIILPTHPLRAAWYAGYSQLLQKWEEQLLQHPVPARKHLVHLEDLRQLAPINTPAFAFHAGSDVPFVFCQNLRFFHGVALPADIPDPLRRVADLEQILGFDAYQNTDERRLSERLARYLTRFTDARPHTRALITTLVNPDRGDIFADAVEQAFYARSADADDTERPQRPVFRIEAFVEDEFRGTLDALRAIRSLQSEHVQGSDVFLPGTAVTVRPARDLRAGPLQDAHLTVVSDIARPRVVTVGAETQTDSGSLSIYGLLARFDARFDAAAQTLRWRYTLSSGAKVDVHPAGPRFGEGLVELHAAWLEAMARALGGQGAPALEVTLDAERQATLERLHAASDWVITLDRFFPLEYFDSPRHVTLQPLARKYLLDYAPELTEGVSHRIMVSTASRDELSALLARAMHDIGFFAVEHSVSRLLQHLKTVSGQLALQSLSASTQAAAAVGLAAATAWLEAQGRLKQAVLVPVDLHPALFSRSGKANSDAGERRCDLVLFALRRNIVEATFIEVKWRRGAMPLDTLAQDMARQMEATADVVRDRYFNEARVDGVLQRATLANVLRFYGQRSERYGLIEPDAKVTFMEHLARLEKSNLSFRATCEGYIVNLADDPRPAFPVGEATITVLTATDFESHTDLAVLPRDAAFGHAEDGLARGAAARPVEPPVVAEQDDSAEETHAASGSPVPEAPPGELAQHPNPIAVAIGEAAGTMVTWRPSAKGSPHLFVIGIPGQGKSWTTTRIMLELGKQGVPALVLDFHGQFADPHEPVVQQLNPLIIDAAQGLPFSPFETALDAGSSDWRETTYAISEIFAYVAGLGDMQKDVVYTALREAYVARGFGQVDAGPRSLPTIEEVLLQIEAREKASKVSNVTARCRPLLEMDLFRPVVGHQDMLATIRSGAIIDLHNLYAETLQQAAGAFVLRKLYKDMFRWGVSERIRLVVVLDEAHRLARDITLPKLMKEGRKFGIAVLVASQGMADFHPDVLSNAGTKIIFRSNYPESKKLAGFIRIPQGDALVAQIEQLAVGVAYVQTPEMPFGARTRMLPLF